MNKVENLKIHLNSTIKDALNIIDQGAMQIALVIDKNNKLLGTISDGDIRRGLLKGLTLDSPISSIIFKNPTVANINNTKEEILRIALSKKIHQIPILDEKGIVIGIQEIDELIKPKEKNNKVVLMAGGLGQRLLPLTEKVPKPMLNVGDKPILQTIIENLSQYGYNDFIICVNYKSEIIQNHFKDGSKFGVKIQYLLEEKRLGTAGALSLINDEIKEPFFVMNSDILTNLNFEHFHDFHVTNSSVATMCVREYNYQVPYGVVNLNESKILSIKEKPQFKYFVSAGIYMLNTEVLNFIPKNSYFDMPTLFEKIISENRDVYSFPLREYWLDIGRIEEYKKANKDYYEIF